MQARTRRILFLFACLFIGGAAVVGVLGYMFRSAESPFNRASAIRTTLAWGRLAPFPISAEEFTISAAGSMFTRGFRVSFIAPTADIERWLKQSPGIGDAAVSFPKPGMRHFEIQPGGGAQHAEVTVDETKRQGSVYAYWRL